MPPLPRLNAVVRARAALEPTASTSTAVSPAAVRPHRSSHRRRGAASASSSSTKPSSSSPPAGPEPPGPSTRPDGLPDRRAGSLKATPGVPVALQIFGAVSLLGSGFYLYKQGFKATDETAPAGRSTFTIPVAGAEPDDAEATMKALQMLDGGQTDKRLKEKEESYAVSRSNNPVYRYDTNAVASNNPIEDDSCHTILSRDPASGVAGDLLLFGVFDGHAGWQTSKLISTQLVQYVARELNGIFEGKVPESLPASVLQTLSNATATAKTQMQKVWELIGGTPGGDASEQNPRSQDLSGNPAVVAAALKTAFLKLDHDIVTAPINLLREREAAERKRKGTSSTTVDGKEVANSLTMTSQSLQTLLPAWAGSCALLAYLDTARHRLHMACTGDSRAVMGIYEPAANAGEVGRWKTVTLTDDQTGRNDSEVKRIRSEHPSSERDRVIARGRVLGGLEPTRAFGDARYKWAKGVQEQLTRAFMPEAIPVMDLAASETPPYVTAEPVVTSLDLPEELSEGRGRRFIIMATDGLWDRISSDEAVALVGAWLDGERGPKPLGEVMKHISPQSSSLGTGYHPSPPVRQSRSTFEDANAATHLIRNALGGSDRQSVSALLSIPAPLSRRYRDDITAHVIFLGERVGQEKGEPEGVRKLTLAKL